MNIRFSSLLITSLAGLMLAGPAAAGPRYMDSEIFVLSEARNEQALPDFGSKGEERKPGKANRKQDKKGERKAEEQQLERDYGYGYERRYEQPERRFEQPERGDHGRR